MAAATVLTATPAAAAAPAAVPRPSTPACGAVLTSSVRLASDVVCPTGGGLTLAADGIELNLNGHRLVGPGGQGRGVVVAARDAVVRNGTITGWGTGVEAGPDDPSVDTPPAVSATLRGLRVDRNTTGVRAGWEGALSVRDTWITGGGRGGESFFDGVLRLDHSVVSGNGIGLFSFSVGWDGLVVRDSVLRENSSAGLACGQDGHYDVARSTLQRNGSGVDAFECSGRVVDSRFVWNDRHVTGFLVDGDVMELRCNTYTRDGSPLEFPVTPCS
ncbi:hypothetical protein GCM10009528_27580 [Kineococcus aurantiacus]